MLRRPDTTPVTSIPSSKAPPVLRHLIEPPGSPLSAPNDTRDNCRTSAGLVRVFTPHRGVFRMQRRSEIANAVLPVRCKCPICAAATARLIQPAGAPVQGGDGRQNQARQGTQITAHKQLESRKATQHREEEEACGGGGRGWRGRQRRQAAQGEELLGAAGGRRRVCRSASCIAGRWPQVTVRLWCWKCTHRGTWLARLARHLASPALPLCCRCSAVGLECVGAGAAAPGGPAHLGRHASPAAGHHGTRRVPHGLPVRNGAR